MSNRTSCFKLNGADLVYIIILLIIIFLIIIPPHHHHLHQRHQHHRRRRRRHHHHQQQQQPPPRRRRRRRRRRLLLLLLLFSSFVPLHSPPSSLSFLRLALGCPFQAEIRSNLPLLRPTLSISTCHSCSSSALTAFSACTLAAMPLAPAIICQLDSFLFKLQGLKHTSFYTNQLLHLWHKHSFTPTTFLQKPAFTPTSFYTNQLLHKLPFPDTTIYTNQLLHQQAFTHTPASTQTNFSTNQLLRKPPFTPTNFYKLAFTEISIYSRLQKPAFTTQLLHAPLFRQTSLLRQPAFTTQLLHHRHDHDPDLILLLLLLLIIIIIVIIVIIIIIVVIIVIIKPTFYTNQLCTTPALGL